MSTPPSWYCDRIRDFARTAISLVTSRGTWREKPLLAVNFVGTGEGGQFERKGQMAEAILATLRVAAQEHDCDFVLVLASASAHAAAQANRVPSDWLELNATVRGKVERLAGFAREKHLVLFLGAGLSQQAGLPVWDPLLKQLASAVMSEADIASLPSSAPIDTAALLESLYRKAGLDFRKEIASLLQSETFSLGQSLAAGLPVGEFVTTNFDDLFERAVKAATSKSLAVLPYEPSSESKGWLLKLHGSVDNPDDIVLTRGDFMRYAQNRAALYGIVQAMLMTRHILFLGFSLSDDNFHRLADEVRQAIEGRSRSAYTESGRTFGTTLIQEQNSPLQQLWEGDLEMVRLDGSTSLAYARAVELALDYLLHLATTLSPHILDDAYESALTEDQRRLKAMLSTLREQLDDHDLASETFAPIRTLLLEHGESPQRLGRGPYDSDAPN